MILTPAIVAAIVAACSTHPTPPPARYVNQAQVEMARGTVVTVRELPADQIHMACGNGESPVDYPNRRYGACTIPLGFNVATSTVNYTMIVPTGNLGAMCHELGHVGGWAGNHPRR